MKFIRVLVLVGLSTFLSSELTAECGGLYLNRLGTFLPITNFMPALPVSYGLSANALSGSVQVFNNNGVVAIQAFVNYNSTDKTYCIPGLSTDSKVGLTNFSAEYYFGGPNYFAGILETNGADDIIQPWTDPVSGGLRATVFRSTVSNPNGQIEIHYQADILTPPTGCPDAACPPVEGSQFVVADVHHRGGISDLVQIVAIPRGMRILTYRVTGQNLKFVDYADVSGIIPIGKFVSTNSKSGSEFIQIFTNSSRGGTVYNTSHYVAPVSGIQGSVVQDWTFAPYKDNCDSLVGPCSTSGTYTIPISSSNAFFGVNDAVGNPVVVSIHQDIAPNIAGGNIKVGDHQVQPYGELTVEFSPNDLPGGNRVLGPDFTFANFTPAMGILVPGSPIPTVLGLQFE
jgi:hypothetical protein